jgi:protein TonB
MSLAAHVYLIWVVQPIGLSEPPRKDRPPVLALALAEFSMESVNSPASSPRPDIKGANVPRKAVRTLPPRKQPPPARKRVKPMRSRTEPVTLAPPMTEAFAFEPDGRFPLPEKASPVAAPETPQPLETVRQPTPPPSPVDKPQVKEPSPSSVPQPANLPSVRRPQGVKTAAHPQGNQKPVYPPEAIRQGLEGLVTVKVRVSATGKVLQATLHESSGHRLLDEATLRHAEQLRFTPAYEGDTPVESIYWYSARFRLVSPY